MADKDNIYLADGFTEIGRSIGAWCMNNRAHICTGLAVGGTITTGVLSARSGARAARKIDRKEKELNRKLTAKEKAKLCGRDFILPTITTAVAIGGAVGSDLINTKSIGILNAQLIASEKAYDALSKKTKEVLGEKKERQVKDEIASEKVNDANLYGPEAFVNAPRCGSGTLYPWVDGYSRLPFWTNADWVSSNVKDLKMLMADLRPRGDEFDYYDKEIGVSYGKEWLSRLGYDKHVWDTPERRHAGWNKGFDKDGSDDDSLDYTTVAREYIPGFAVTVLDWECEPRDMRLGRLLKSSGVGCY